MPLQYIGLGGSASGTWRATDGSAPGATTVHTSTATGDLLVWLHYGRGTGGNETISWPAGWNEVFNTANATYGHFAMAWRIRESGDTTYTSTVSNYTTGTSGETILQAILTFRGHNATTPIGSHTATASTWASSLTLGSIAAPSSTSLPNGDWVVVAGFRFENVTGQTTLTGDNLTWSAITPIPNTTSGSDAGGSIQYGANNSGSTQTITAKSITTTGTTQVGQGRMFVIQAAPLALKDVIGSGIIPWAR